MTVSLYDLSVGTYIQGVQAMIGFLEKGAAHCAETGAELNALCAARLAPDMHPLRYQVQSVRHHSVNAIRALLDGKFYPPSNHSTDIDYQGLQVVAAQTLSELEAFDAAEIDGLGQGDVIFDIGERRIPFVGQDFILSFSIPNFHFHRTTAYDILRNNGAPVGKRDYLGKLRIKT